LRQVLLREEMMRRYMPHHELGPGGTVPDELLPFAFAGDAVEASALRPARPGRLCAWLVTYHARLVKRVVKRQLSRAAGQNPAVRAWGREERAGGRA
jgi:hypothetical protein